MTPENGGTFELKLLTGAGEVAEYEVALSTASQTYRAQARVSAQGVTFEGFQGGEPPEWLLADTRAALRSAFRTNQAEGRWPRRLTRWRPEPSA